MICFIKDDIIKEKEDCGCRWIVLKVNKNGYLLKHKQDGDTIKWDKNDCELHCEKE